MMTPKALVVLAVTALSKAAPELVEKQDCTCSPTTVYLTGTPPAVTGTMSIASSVYTITGVTPYGGGGESTDTNSVATPGTTDTGSVESTSTISVIVVPTTSATTTETATVTGTSSSTEMTMTGTASSTFPSSSTATTHTGGSAPTAGPGMGAFLGGVAVAALVQAI
ncbi:hypothetical protein F5Y16DRAFT_375105 [Xylariaceae sp. FL0255]|nr:hypothetical protein F5Y16DRAFT_375105 [Xylariaceae sp. FL0255]